MLLAVHFQACRRTSHATLVDQPLLVHPFFRYLQPRAARPTSFKLPAAQPRNNNNNNSDAGHPSERGFRRQACNRVKTSFSAMRPPPGWGCQSCCFGYGAPPPGGCPGGPGPVGRSSSIGMPFASRGRRSSRLRLLISLSIQWTECPASRCRSQVAPGRQQHGR